MEQEFYKKYIQTPIGWLEIKSTSVALCAIRFVNSKGIQSQTQPRILSEAANQLKEYFQGSRKIFDLDITPEGTEFQQKVWNMVQLVPFGETASYLDISIKTGSEKNTRAVGLANAKNPIPIVIPCHRIIGANGKLTGYAGGLEKKRWLLQHELSNSDNPDLLF
uniref:methylated-DNA--[protein]-cysteine S-methyltransferase n=1 Tax=uncultured Draconibacterium sp. TaxID=1573823 RepID=UPI003216F126